MWYRIAKQGSLWQRVSPTFEQDVEDAIKSATVIKDFSSDDVDVTYDSIAKELKKNNNDVLKFNVSGIIDFNGSKDSILTKKSVCVQKNHLLCRNKSM